MDTRRQSGLWKQNEATGLYEREAPAADPGPYRYYQPPPRTSATSDRRSFAERAGTALTSTYDPDAPSRTDSLRTAAEDAAVKMNTRTALLAHENILASPAHTELVRRLHEHEAGGEADSMHFAKTGHFVDSLPAAMAVSMGPADSAQFSRSRHASEAGLEDVGRDIKAAAAGQGVTALPAVGGTGPESLAKTRHVNEVGLPGSSTEEAILGGEEDTGDNVPENLRTKAWSPAPDAMTESVPAQTAATLDDAPARRASVPDRSPLQKLERDSSKEEKRARLQEAENRAIQRQGTLRSEKGRVVSEGSASSRPRESTSDKYYQNSPRQVSAGSTTLGAVPPMERSQRASDAMKNGTASGAVPAIAREAQPYHHAPAIPRSFDSVRRKELANDSGPAIAKEPRPYHHAPVMPRSMDSTRRRVVSEDNRALPPQTRFGTPPIAKEPRPYHHAPEAPRSLGVARYASGNGYRASGEQPRASMDGSPRSSETQRNASGRYKHRLRDAGYIGAATAAAAGAGALAYEATTSEAEKPAPSEPRNSGDIVRSGSKKLQKQPPPGRASTEMQRSGSVKETAPTEPKRSGKSGSMRERLRKEPPGPITREQAKTEPSDPVPFQVPPQTAAGQAAREQVGFDKPASEQQPQRDHHLGGMFHHHNDTEGRTYQPSKPLEEWRGVAPVSLTLGDLEFDQDGRAPSGATAGSRDSTWWERDRGAQRASTSKQAQPTFSQYDGAFEEEAKLFRPPMFLKCGPLLRYTGLRRQGESEIWRGSIMIVTEDEQSDYSTVPSLRLFAQPMDLYQPTSKHPPENGQDDTPDYDDPIAGQVKVSRTGRPLYVRPVHDLEPGTDLSREEHNQGLYAATKTPLLGTSTSSHADGRQSQHITVQDRSRIKGRDGEKAGRYKDVRAVRLHAERGFTFWRWSIEIELGSRQHRVAYRINRGPALGFWVPARGETMNLVFHSCNGFSMSVDSNEFCGPDPLWRDVLNKHQSRPFHAMIGGGDQVYNDLVMHDTTLFREWLQTKNPEYKHRAEFTLEMQDELESFYLNRYSMWFSQGLFAMAGSQIPMVNVWDDHDIIDGYGSYPHHFMSTRVFTGLGAIAFKYYMLFQHQSLATETTKDEPSWVLGAGPGPYINELSRHVFLDLGRKVKFLGVDCRTERMRDEVLSEDSYDILFNRCRAEITKGETRHLLVLLGVPIAYPRLNFLENILTSRMMDPIKAIGRTGMLGGFVNKFDGGVEILDDLDDHWTAKHHKAERNWFIQELQELAAEKSIRVTILGGDVHLGAVGQFYSPKKLGIGKDRDHRYMPNVISSAIVNTPPPIMAADVLNKRNKVHHLDWETDEDMIPMFELDVDGSRRNNKCLLPRRNYCTIREFQPGHTPPSTPPPERNLPVSRPVDLNGEGSEMDGRDSRFSSNSTTRRTMSLTRGPANLVRRLSGSRNRNPPSSLAQVGAGSSGISRSQSLDQPRPALSTTEAEMESGRRPSFHRRPTNLTEKEVRKAAARGGAPDEEGAEDNREPGHIDLENGLDISLNMEVDQHDAIGHTQAYRLLVPALWYSGAPDINTLHLKPKRGTIIDRLRGKGRKAEESHDGSQTPSPAPDVQASAARPPGQQGVAAGGTDGAYDARNGASAQQPAEQMATAYGQGYNLSAPPIGSGQFSQHSQGQSSNNPYQHSGYRDTNAPVSPERGQEGQYDELEDEEGSDATGTSEEYVDARDRQPKRLSKAERIFGIGDGGAGRNWGAENGTYAPAKKRANWKIWK